MDNKENPHISKVYNPTRFKHRNGHVISIELQDDSSKVAETFYNNCTIPIKGTSLGFQNTILMPYSLTTYFHDNNVTIADTGLKQNLLRLTAGTEVPDAIIRDLTSGFRTVNMYNDKVLCSHS